MSSIKTIQYNGEYPALCMGTLHIEMTDGVSYNLDYILESGGKINWDDDDMYPTNGSWDINIDELPDGLKMHYNEILEWVRCNVPDGCCGGCV